MLLLPFLPLFFHMALAAPGCVVLVMTSLTSGYVTIGRHERENVTDFRSTNFSIPARHTLMISFKTLLPYRVFVHIIERTAGKKVWSTSFDYRSNFFHLYRSIGTEFTVQVTRNQCFQETYTPCFQLFFSCLPENKAPQKLPTGLWNCSVEHYSSFHHHMACNMKTECEDGRDETEQCPFSSVECRGLVALCDKCYKIFESFSGFDDDETKYNGRIDQYCNSFGGTLGFPTCVYDMQSVIANNSNTLMSYLYYFLVGLQTNDMTLPNMYRQSLYKEDRTIFHHLFEGPYRSSGRKRFRFLCLRRFNIWNGYWTFFLLSYEGGAICEVRLNKTKEEYLRPSGVALGNTKSTLPQTRHSVKMCRDDEVTRKQLFCGSSLDEACSQQYSSLCRSSNQTLHINLLKNTDADVDLAPAFTCSVDDTTTVSYTLVCDFTADCRDSSDESFCRHPLCASTFFTCTSGQCVSYSKVCDQLSHCQDESDERNCVAFREEKFDMLRLPSPALVNFNGISRFTATPMNSNESCPHSHYRCPGQFNDCLPIYTRCNEMHDCMDHQDEEGCEEVKCPGLLQCRSSTICVHNDHVCDGWPHCPMHDDELWCNVLCPEGCLCWIHSLLCLHPINAAIFPQIRSLDAAGSGMTLLDVGSNAYLVRLILASCSLTFLPVIKLFNLRFLDLSDNNLQHVNVTSFLGLEAIQSLSISNNPITTLSTDLYSNIQQNALSILDLSRTNMTVFDSKHLAQFTGLKKLNLTFTSIHTINSNGFQFISQLIELYTYGSPVKTFPLDIFTGLIHLRIISSQNYRLCCSEILPPNSEVSSCYAPKDEISSCEDLLQSWTYRGFLWLITCLSVSGNIFCFCARLVKRSLTSLSGFSVFVTNLTMADFLMGVYMAVIGVADDHYRDRYLHYDDTWKNSVTCKVAGVLSLLSCEVSALIILLITLDRFIVLCFPFSVLRLERTSAAMVCLMTWLTGWFLALLPLLPVTSHWEFYSQTGICIPLPVTRQEFKGKHYSFGVLIGLNFVLFLLISVGQAFIYWSIQSNTLKTSSTKVSQDMTIAQRLITIALTDFMCWFPIGLCGMLALSGTPIPGEVNVALAIFILPLNAAINPFLYTFNTLSEKWRKSKESKLLESMEAYTNLTTC